MKYMSNEKSYYIVIDADSITGKMIEQLILAFEEAGINNIASISTIGKNNTVLEQYRNKFSQLFPNTQIICKSVGSFQNEADIFCAAAAGIYLNEIITSADPGNKVIAIISNDKLVVSVGNIVQEHGVPLIILDSVTGAHIDYNDPNLIRLNLTPISKLNIKATTEKEAKPQSWYFTDFKNIENKIGFRCTSVGNEELYPAPVFIPFPEQMPLFSVGRCGDIALAPWDVKNGLYDKNVEIEYHPYPQSNWTIRSLKGVRRGKKEITVNGKMISSMSSDVVIRNGDKIGIGVFSFVFITNPMSELEQYEDPKALIEQIEKSLKAFIEQNSELTIPSYVREEIEDQNGRISLNNAYLRHYRKILKANWNASCLAPLKERFNIKQFFDDTFIEINGIRNMVFHPSKPAITLEQKRQLAKFYLDLKRAGIIQ